ncbi:MAG: hypothetical protein ACI4SS_03265, partial [Clostridia bacterium]
MKKYVFILLFILAILPVGALAEETSEFSVVLLQEGGFPQTDEAAVMELGENDEALYNDMVYAFRNLADGLYVAEYEVTPDELMNVFGRVINENPEFFYIDSSVEYSYDPMTGNVINMTVPYNCNKLDVPEMRREVEAEASKVRSLVTEGMTELERVILVHDYIV